MADDHTASAAPTSVCRTALLRALARLARIPILLVGALRVLGAQDSSGEPLPGLHELDKVTTLREQGSIWIFWPAVRGEVQSAAYGPSRLRALALAGALHVTCRAGAKGSPPSPTACVAVPGCAP